MIPRVKPAFYQWMAQQFTKIYGEKKSIVLPRHHVRLILILFYGDLILIQLRYQYQHWKDEPLQANI